MKARLQAHLVTEGIDAILPPTAFSAIDRAAEQTPEQVYALAKNELEKAPNAQAIYFQGAPLDPLQVIERIETDLGVPVVASNPTMLWHICTKVGLRFSVPGHGRLLREWPDPVPA
jgi:maleate isomerase